MNLRSTLDRALQTSCWLGLALCAGTAQNGSSPVSTPAGTEPPFTASPAAKPVSDRNAREADNWYLDGARHIDKRDYIAAETDFAHAVALNPNSSDYIRAFAYAREGRVSSLMHAAAIARHDGKRAEADALLQQAKVLDPDNRILAEHIENGADVLSPTFDPLRFPAANITSTLAGAIEFAADPKQHHDVHAHGDPQSAIREVYRQWDIEVTFDSAPTTTQPVNIDLADIDFHSASDLIHRITKTFAVAVQPKLALIAADSEESRRRLEPQLEETLYLPGLRFDQFQELRSVASDVIGVQSITTAPTAGTVLVRCDAATMSVLNTTFADLLDGSSDVMLDMAVYEVDRSRTRNFGIEFPGSVGLFSVGTELQNALDANQALLNAAKSSGLISQGTLTDNAFKIVEVFYLYQAGLLSATQSSEIKSLLSLGYIGSIKGLPLAGITLASGAAVNALLQSSDARLLDTIMLRASSNAAAAATPSGATTAGAPPAAPPPSPAAPVVPPSTTSSGLGPSSLSSSSLSSASAGASTGTSYTASFRSGQHYPIETSSYTTGGSSGALSSALAGASAAVQQAAAAILGNSSSTTVPQISFEDLGLTLEATPTIQRDQTVRLSLHLKIEALGSGSLNGIPVLNNREFTSVVTIPAGQTALLSSVVNSNEIRAIEGFPALSELPGFQSTENNGQLNTQELLITLTPHIVRDPKWHVESRVAVLPQNARP